MSFQRIGDLAAKAVSKTACENKLRLIDGLDADELRGWIDKVKSASGRPYFDGERTALVARARKIGVRI